MGKGFDLRFEHGRGNVLRLCFFRKQHGAIEILRSNAGNADAGGFDREDLVDAVIRKKPVKLLADLVEQTDIHLMIQKGIHFQDITRKKLSVLQDSFFQKLHCKNRLPVRE